jgi:hypothetical protein
MPPPLGVNTIYNMKSALHAVNTSLREVMPGRGAWIMACEWLGMLTVARRRKEWLMGADNAVLFSYLIS